MNETYVVRVAVYYEIEADDSDEAEFIAETCPETLEPVRREISTVGVVNE